MVVFPLARTGRGGGSRRLTWCRRSRPPMRGPGADGVVHRHEHETSPQPGRRRPRPGSAPPSREPDARPICRTGFPRSSCGADRRSTAGPARSRRLRRAHRDRPARRWGSTRLRGGVAWLAGSRVECARCARDGRPLDRRQAEERSGPAGIRRPPDASLTAPAPSGGRRPFSAARRSRRSACRRAGTCPSTPPGCD